MKPNRQRKGIEQLDLVTGEVVAQYNLLKEDAKAVGMPLPCISMCIAGKCKSVGTCMRVLPFCLCLSHVLDFVLVN
jgi:hypothetical protein